MLSLKTNCDMGVANRFYIYIKKKVNSEKERLFTDISFHERSLVYVREIGVEEKL
jgi:hypothetical protein